MWADFCWFRITYIYIIRKAQHTIILVKPLAWRIACLPMAWETGSIPGRVIPKTQKMVPDTSRLNTQHYKVRIKGKVQQSREKISIPTTPLYNSYWKESPWVTIDYSCPLYLYLLKEKSSYMISNLVYGFYYNHCFICL